MAKSTPKKTPNSAVAQRLRLWLTSAEARKAGFRYRTYQAVAAQRCFAALYSWRNVVLPLPTGTGKTLISNLVTRLFRHADPTSRTLVVVPRRVLVSQHAAYANWMIEDVDSYHLSDYSVQNPMRFAANSANSQLLFTTPDLFANKVKSGLITPAVRKSIRLVIVDEFDEFLMPEFTNDGCVCRFDVAFQNCLDVLPRCAFLLMSATTPGNCKDAPIGAELNAASLKVKSYFNPLNIDIPRTSYREHIPVTKLELCHVSDQSAESLDAAVSSEISMLLSLLEKIHTGKVDRPWVLTRIDGLAEGRINNVRTQSGKILPVGRKLVKLFERVRHFHYLRSFVYEDMCAGLYAEEMEMTRVNDPVSGQDVEFFGRVRLRGLTSDFEHLPRLGMKAQATLEISKKKGKIVLMFRYVRLLNAIAERLRKSRVRFVTLHGDLTDRQRESALLEFRNGTTGVLMMTRDTGKRGLDLPQAQRALFYSPKASETSTFQEASRIRSTTANIKTCHVLCYGHTDERPKLARLIGQILLRMDREYRIVDPSGLLKKAPTS